VDNQSITPASKGFSYQLRSAEIVATVEKIDRKKRQVTLRGPERTVTLQVAADLPLDRIKFGDSVRANYTAATAVEITRDGQSIR
jgi:Cu/Ag efflux protein CusF